MKLLGFLEVDVYYVKRNCKYVYLIFVYLYFVLVGCKIGFLIYGIWKLIL